MAKNIKIEGINDILKKLQDLQKNVRKLEDTNKISFTELFNPDFMRKYTDSKTIEDFLTNSGLIPEDPEEITEEMFETPEFNEYVKQRTNFNSWSEMLSKAGEEWITKKLKL